MTQRQIKFRFRFSEHEPVVFKLEQIIFGLAAHGYDHTWGVVVGMDEWTGWNYEDGSEVFEGDKTNEGTIQWFTDLHWDSGGSCHPGFYFKELHSDHDDENVLELSYHTSFYKLKLIQ